ncbi:hypothetical protein AJ87_45560 [Rhizobium yanglingense]|nr:hypothetical protein AJ87_45560 [Rhizobium yanglingense]
MRDERLPVGAAENIIAEGQRVSEIILFHNPRCAKAAAVDAVLDGELVKHHLLENLGKRVTSRIGAMRRILGDRSVVAVVEMADTGITADEDELLCSSARTEGFE